MKFITKLIFLLIIMFIINVILYSYIDGYKDIIERIKGKEINNNIILDNKKDNENKIEIKNNLINSKQIEEKKGNLLINNIKESIPIDLDNKYPEKKSIVLKTVTLGREYKKILKLFEKYKPGLIEIQSSLFDLTDEYPGKYFEYYSKEVTIYFFTGKKYDEIKDILKAATYDLPLEIKEVNNIGTKSFYINMNEGYKDGYVRLVILNKTIVFGLKIKKEIYNEIKQILIEL